MNANIRKLASSSIRFFNISFGFVRKHLMCLCLNVRISDRFQKAIEENYVEQMKIYLFHSSVYTG